MPQKTWRRLSLLFLSLLPALAIFHLVMWFCFTRTLFRPETGSSKRMGYLVGLEDCQGKLEAREPQTGFKIIDLADPSVASGTRAVYFGDSFGGHLAKACSILWHEPVGLVQRRLGARRMVSPRSRPGFGTTGSAPTASRRSSWNASSANGSTPLPTRATATLDILSGAASWPVKPSSDVPKSEGPGPSPTTVTSRFSSTTSLISFRRRPST